MRRVLLAVVVGLGFWSAPASARTDAWVGATAYCLHGTMSDGSYTRPRSAAVIPGTLPLGTRIRITSARSGPGGMRRYVVRDHIGYGSSLDLWVPSCGQAISWGRRALSYKIGWSR